MHPSQIPHPPKALKVWIGFDRREAEAFHVARHSILKRTSKLVKIRALKLTDLKKILTRPIEKKDGKMWCPISQAPMATEFAISRFAVPFLTRKGWALFCDCDVLFRADIAELFALADPQYAVMVVHHDYKPTETTKMDGQVQTSYPRKGQSSVMLWNCDHPSHKNLTPEVLNTWPGRDLHAFKWLKDDEIGELPQPWNYLVGVTTPIPMEAAKCLHLTNGGPWFPDWKGGAADELWLNELADMQVRS